MKRTLKKKRKAGAGLFQSLASVLLLLVALAGGVFWANRFLPRPLERNATAADTAKSNSADSLSRALAGLDSVRIRSFWDAYSNPQKSVGEVIPGTPLRVNFEALARRHPAWLLADSLQDAGVSPRAGREIEVAPRPTFSLVSPSATQVENLPIAPGKTLEKRASSAGLERAQDAQFDAFSRAWGARQEAIRVDEAALRARELEDQIREKLRQAVEVVGLDAVSPETALELSNLRLQLLQNLALSPLQREAAKEKIAAIEARLAAIWRAQTAKQEAILEEAFKNAPERTRREGLEKIRAAMREFAQADFVERERLQSELESLAARDFAAAREQSLLLFLPPTAILSQALDANNFEPSRQNTTSARNALKALGTRNVTPLAQIMPAASAQIASLRAKARSDARSWARQIAGQLGGVLSNSPTAQDVTPQAQRLLWPAI